MSPHTAPTLPLTDDYTTESHSHSGRVVATTYSPRTLDDRYLVPSELGEVELPEFERRPIYDPDPALDTWDSELDASIEPAVVEVAPEGRGWGAIVAFVAGVVVAGGTVAVTLFAGVAAVGLVAVAVLVSEGGPQAAFVGNDQQSVEAPADSLPTGDEERSDGTFFVLPDNN